MRIKEKKKSSRGKRKILIISRKNRLTDYLTLNCNECLTNDCKTWPPGKTSSHVQTDWPDIIWIYLGSYAGGGKKSITAEDQRRHHGGELELGRLGEKTTGTEPRKIGPSAEGRSANRRWSPSPVEIWSGWTLSHHCGCSRISSLLVDCYVFIFVAYFVYCKFGRTRTSWFVKI